MHERKTEPYDRCGIVAVGGSSLYWETRGEGRPLVFLHGLTLDRRLWDEQFRHFSTNNLAIRYDLRGFGKSSDPSSESYSHVEDLRILLDELGLERATLIGLSMGGRIAINFALAHPDRLDALVLINSTLTARKGGELMATFDPAMKDFGASIPETIRREGEDIARAMWRATPLFRTRPENRDATALVNAMLREYRGWHWRHTDPVRDECPDVELLRRIATPTLVLVGSEDLRSIHRTAGILEGVLPASTLTILDDTGHLANLDAPDAVISAIQELLSDLNGISDRS